MESFLKPTVFIIDDDPTFKSNLSWQLESLGFVTKTFSFLETFFTFYREDIPGCLIIDIRAAGSVGAGLIATLRHKNIHLTVIFLSEKPEVSMAVKAIKLGAIDFLHKTVDSTTLVGSINQALHSNHTHRSFEEGLYRANMLYAQLSMREKEVFQLVLRGFRNKNMAEKLAVTLKTIEAHRANIMSKMQVDSLPKLVTLAVKFHLATEDELCLTT
jgi:FixJ family two-component response regulator